MKKEEMMKMMEEEIEESFDVEMSAASTVIHRKIDDYPDSIEIGTPSKAGTVKVYLNVNDIKGSEQKIINALQLRKFMRENSKAIDGDM
jgi:hypothetical protein